MAHRVNIILDDHAWEALQHFPKGKRSRLVNDAIISIAKTEQMYKAAAKMDSLRNKMPKVSTQEIVSSIRKDRNRT